MSDFDWDLVDRCLAGQATVAEREQLERAMAEDPEKAALLAALRSALESMEGKVTREEVDALWAGLARRAGFDAVGQESRPERRPVKFALSGASRPRTRWPFALAAAAVLAVGAGLAVRGFREASQPSRSAEEQVVTVPRGQRAQFRLADGTQVLLGGGSTLRHPGDFNGAGAREVSLEGEAYFAVEHDPRRPFRVRAGNLVATDLGTEFVVRAFPETEGAQVIVRSGTVAVRPLEPRGESQAGATVRPGELGRIDAGGQARVERADTAVYFAWTTGTLVFDGTPLRQALPQLSRWYDLDFQLDDSSLGAIPLSGRLGQTLTPARLDLLAASMGLKQVQRGRTVTFSRMESKAR
jgi:transmembrane sensor